VSHLINLRFAIALAVVGGFAALAVGTTHVMSSAIEPDASISATPSPVIAEEIPTLPTIVVTADIEYPVLPVVVVTPSDEDRLAASDSKHQVAASGESRGSSSPLMHEILPHVRLDMPYYSFGKMMPRAIKD
jgi:hypothetical protein